MPWRGISEAIDAYGRMRVRARLATAEAAVQGAAAIRDYARMNILNRFVQHTGNLFESMTSDQRARALSSTVYVARAYPRGPSSPLGTPYGRIQELGGTIRAHNPTGKLWFTSIQDSGKVGVISVEEVTLEGRFYLRDAVVMAEPELHSIALRDMGAAVHG